MTVLADDEDAELVERSLMDGLFREMGLSDPQAVLRTVPAPGCRYRFVREALHDPRFEATTIPSSPNLMFQTVARFLARLPPERHKAVRRHFSGLFTPRRVERYRARITERVDALIGDLVVAGPGPVDLVTTFARPLPFSVIADVLGVSAQHQPWLGAAMEVFGQAVAGQRDRANVERGNAATAEMLDWFDAALRDRADQPREDVLSLLAATPADGEQRADLLANCLFFVLAGHATTTTLLTAGVHLLAEHRAQLDELLARTEGWAAAVEELLRYISPTTLTGVTARVEAEIDGCSVPAGGRRALAFAAANRDPGVFDRPDELDLTRSPNPHLAFSAGPHFCLGAPLARMHAEIALPALFGGLPGLRVTAPPTWLGSAPIRQVAALPVEWTTRAVSS